MCYQELTTLLEQSGETIIGEMAHVIAHKDKGPRGDVKKPAAERDKYENLILLCPTHHTLIDKAPADFEVEKLLAMKKQHEEKISALLATGIYENKDDLFRKLRRLSTENHAILMQYGPDSKLAKERPMSDGAFVWAMLRLQKIVPNNRIAVNLLDAHQELLSDKDFETFVAFRTHADAFERWCLGIASRETVERFPPAYQKMIEGN